MKLTAALATWLVAAPVYGYSVLGLPCEESSIASECDNIQAEVNCLTGFYSGRRYVDEVIAPQSRGQLVQKRPDADVPEGVYSPVSEAMRDVNGVCLVSYLVAE